MRQGMLGVKVDEDPPSYRGPRGRGQLRLFCTRGQGSTSSRSWLISTCTGRTDNRSHAATTATLQDLAATSAAINSSKSDGLSGDGLCTYARSRAGEEFATYPLFGGARGGSSATAKQREEKQQQNQQLEAIKKQIASLMATVESMAKSAPS